MKTYARIGSASTLHLIRKDGKSYCGRYVERVVTVKNGPMCTKCEKAHNNDRGQND